MQEARGLVVSAIRSKPRDGGWPALTQALRARIAQRRSSPNPAGALDPDELRLCALLDQRKAGDGFDQAGRDASERRSWREAEAAACRVTRFLRARLIRPLTRCGYPGGPPIRTGSFPPHRGWARLATGQKILSRRTAKSVRRGKQEGDEPTSRAPSCITLSPSVAPRPATALGYAALGLTVGDVPGPSDTIVTT